MNPTQEIMALEQRRREAMTKADVDTLEELFADDLMWIHATARADTKQGLLATIASGKTKYLSIDCSEETVRFYGSMAAVSGIADMTAEIAGEHRVLQSRFTILWHQQPAGWRVVNWQSTTVRKP
jgi:uncharacterized protein (TIGR02246 family)